MRTQEHPFTNIIDRIYEAAVVTERWPEVLEQIGKAVGARGGVFIAVTAAGPTWTCAPSLERHMSDYAAAGWAENTEHIGPLFADPHPGFRAETAYRTIEQIEALPVKREFMIPRGLIAGAASVFPGASNNALYMAVEGFDTHGAAEKAVSALDRLRPHIGRALSLTAQVNSARNKALVEGLQLSGVGAAIIGRDGRLKAYNSVFDNEVGSIVDNRPGASCFTDRFLQTAIAEILSGKRSAGQVASIALRPTERWSRMVVHVIPLTGRAREVGDSDGVLLLVANGTNRLLPDQNLLRLLFDLTPAEARVARAITEGATIEHIARTGGTSAMTVRTQLRSVFAKTGSKRQAELVRLLMGITRPPNVVS
ncbi:helix-turn-helix transcriptional regulator [Sphingomonas flavescens]|uniref:helix-turn-helix transcriptional regulator n=1 Tax=Sphingomonas flavescens TaxID=3132797 RepID=UPI002805CCEF|nr:helix-turn-helix transcriptional regulator [Sphingomonas limnosediminicola]